MGKRGKATVGGASNIAGTQELDDHTIKEMADGVENEFREYMDRSSWAFSDTFEMTPDTTPEELQAAIDGWHYRTMKLTVVRFVDFYEPARLPDGSWFGPRVLLRDTMPDGIMYRLPHGNWWLPSREKALAAEGNYAPMLYAGFDTEGDKVLPHLQSEDTFFIRGGFNYEELVKEDALTDSLYFASKEVYGIWDEVTGWVLPVTDNSVILWRAYGEGRSNYLNIYWGDTWRRDHERYAMYYRNDPNDEAAVLADISRYEAELQRLVTFGLDPRG